MLTRCMGSPDVAYRCQKCARLPRTPEEEDGEDWYDYRSIVDSGTCQKFRGVKDAE